MRFFRNESSVAEANYSFPTLCQLDAPYPLLSLATNLALLVYLGFAGNLAIGGDYLDDEVHLTEAMRSAGEAGVVAADCRFNPIEGTFSGLAALDVSFGDLRYSVVDSGIIVTGSHNQVGFANHTAGVYLVMMDERASRSFDDAYPLFIELRGGNAYFRRADKVVF